jgi:nitrous oxide reductase accessory protein NosL
MTNLFRTIAYTLSLIVFSFTAVSAAETIKCSECGMMVEVNSTFASKIVQADKTLYFCDIGDLFSYLKRTKQNDFKAAVKDYKTGDWIDARTAYYVHAEKKFRTPMGWGIASFKNQKDAAEFGTVMDFDAAAKALK